MSKNLEKKVVENCHLEPKLQVAKWDLFVLDNELLKVTQTRHCSSVISCP